MNTLRSQTARRHRMGIFGPRAAYFVGVALTLISLTTWAALPPVCSVAASSSQAGSELLVSASTQKNPASSLTFNRWGSNAPDGMGIVGSLAVDAGNPAVVYAGTASGVFRSTDNGGSWSRLDGLSSRFFQNDPSIPVTTPLAIDPLHTSTIYAGTDRDGVFKSTDNGVNWSAINVGLPKDFPDVYALAVDPVNTETVYAAVNGSLFKSTNGGAAWHFLGLFYVSVSTLTIAPGSPGTIYVTGSDCWSDPGAGCTGFLAWSADGGASWKWLSCYCAEGFGAPAIDPHDSNNVYFGASGHVLKTSDGGESWEYLGDGLSSDYSFNFVNALAIDPGNPNVIYAGTGGAGVFKSADGGASWSPFNEGLTDPYVNALAIDHSGRNLHAGTRTGVFDYRDTTNCAYSISPTGQSFPAAGASGSAGVTAGSGCSWEASSAVSWITITSGASGVGSGTLVFSVAADTGTIPRTGTLSIAGQTFIVNQAGTYPPNSIDDTQFFVRQHYLDFLLREPDPTGFAFWVNNIESCGSDAQCREVKRIDTSAAFFLSIEFQGTGYVVYRMYKTAYGDLPGTPVPITLNEFLADAKRVGQGVIVNVGDWEAQLNSNKQAFATSLASSTRFTAAYPQTLTAAEFVDSLNQNAGGVLSQAARDQLINDLLANAKTRAEALMTIAEDDKLVRQEFNRAFVLMQYFGYLRRNPNEGPDMNFGGYNFWLAKLNQFQGNFIEAEMVKAFISSSEYRNRFGP